MSKRTFLIGAVAAGLAVSVATAAVPVEAQAHPKPPPHAPIDRQALQEALDDVVEAGSPGAIAEVRDGWWRWPGASGQADLHTGKPAHPWMRHRVGSITKTFVATALLQLVGEQRLSLGDPVGQWLPELADSDVGAEVTVEMLLNHTSGIGNHTDALITSVEDVERLGETEYEPWQLVEIGLALPRTGEPGESFSYSNTNYVLAGLILEAVTGQDPAKEISKRIIRPLGLWHTYFPGDERRIRGPHMGAYFAPLGERDFSEGSVTWAWMAGELVSTTGDLNTFFRALLSGKLLEPEQLDQMRTTVPMDPDLPEAGGYGLGLYTVPTPCGPVWGHDGGMVGQVTASLHTPDGGRQTSFGLNLSHYWQGEVHPIDIAVGELLLAGLCPELEPAPSTRSAEPSPLLPVLPHLPRL
jgi:D-alanyl-D-alanine carboxypeptidase